MTAAHAKLVLVGVALLAAYFLFGDNANAAPTPSPATPTPPQPCASPSAPCKWDTTKCCTPCSALPNCTVTPTPGDVLPPPGGDGPVTDPFGTSVDAGPIVSPDQV